MSNQTKKDKLIDILSDFIDPVTLNLVKDDLCKRIIDAVKDPKEKGMNWEFPDTMSGCKMPTDWRAQQ